MAVRREGGTYRKATEAEAKAMQDKQARAAIRKLTRRLEAQRPEAYEYREFLRACISDVQHHELKVA